MKSWILPQCYKNKKKQKRKHKILGQARLSSCHLHSEWLISGHSSAVLDRVFLLYLPFGLYMTKPSLALQTEELWSLNLSLGWKDGSAVIRACCSCRGWSSVLSVHIRLPTTTSDSRASNTVHIHINKSRTNLFEKYYWLSKQKNLFVKYEYCKMVGASSSSLLR